MTGTGSTVLRTTGTSMLPSVPPGAMLVARSRPHRLRPGDVAVFRTQGGLVVHRVVTRRTPREMGDASDRATRFEADDVIGVVVAVHDGDRSRDLTTPAQRLRARLMALRSLTRLARRRLRWPRTVAAEAATTRGNA